MILENPVRIRLRGMHARVPPTLLVLALIVTAASFPGAQQPPGNYDEGKVPAYTLPDPLVMADGTKVTTAAAWTSRRRPELLDLFAREVYGRTPPSPIPLRATVDRRSPTRSAARPFDVR